MVPVPQKSKSEPSQIGVNWSVWRHPLLSLDYGDKESANSPLSNAGSIKNELHPAKSRLYTHQLPCVSSHKKLCTIMYYATIMLYNYVLLLSPAIFQISPQKHFLCVEESDVSGCTQPRYRNLSVVLYGVSLPGRLKNKCFNSVFIALWDGERWSSSGIWVGLNVSEWF